MSHSILLLNQSWLQEELTALGHKVKSVSMSDKKADMLLKKGDAQIGDVIWHLKFVPDRLIYWDDSTLCWVKELENLPIPTLFLSVDTHQHHHWHAQFSAVFDKTLVAQKDYLPKVQEFSPNAEWFPLWADLPPVPGEFERTVDVSFVGTIDPKIHPERAQFFAQVGREVPVEIGTGDYRPLYQRSKIVLNQTVKGDLNFRVFEALNCGALLVTPRIQNGLPELFTEGEEILCYEPGNAADAVRQIRSALSDPKRLQRIAAAGQEKVRRFHTKKARAEQISTLLSTLKKETNRYKFFGLAHAYLATFVTSKNHDIEWGVKFLEEARTALLRSDATKDVDRTVLLLSELTSQLGEPEKALTFLELAKRQLSNSRLIDIAIVQKLLQLDRRPRAEELAKQLFHDPKGFCDGIQEQLLFELERIQREATLKEKSA